MQRIVITVTPQMDGYTLRLHPKSRARIADQVASAGDLPSSLFFSYDTKRSFQDIHGAIWPHAVELLTGLTPDQIQEIGGYELIEAGTNARLYPPAEERPAGGR